jgi:hypothetical protein
VLHNRCFLTGRGYARRIRSLALTCATLAAIAVASGCGGSNHQASGPPVTATTAPTTTTTAAADPLAGAGTTTVSAPATATETALLERIALGRHEGYDRVVFQFRGNGLPGYRVEYVQPPLSEDGSGAPVTVNGNAFAVVRMEPASGFDLNTGEGVLVYKGPKRIEGADSGTSVVKEVVRTGDFESVLSWAVGLDDKVGFRVTTAASPARLIVDFRNR